MDPLERGAQWYHWLDWAREIQTLAQIGRQYSKDHFNLERHERLSQIAAEVFEEHTDLSADRSYHSHCEQIGYANPCVDLLGAVFQADRFPLVKERQEGGWTIPGGWADVRDKPGASVERNKINLNKNV